MQKFFLRVSFLCASLGLTLSALGQQAPAVSKAYDKILPDDLPTAKLLFVKFRPVPVPAERPQNMSPDNYKALKQHAVDYPKANDQLEKAAAHYPFAYRITTRDSTAYYATRGFKYVLFHQSFGKFTDGNYKEPKASNDINYKENSIPNDIFVDLYIQDLSSRDRYRVDAFSETSIYNYKGLVGMLLKRVEKQFKAKK